MNLLEAIKRAGVTDWLKLCSSGVSWVTPPSWQSLSVRTTCLATLHIPRREEREAEEPQPALQARGLRQPPPWGSAVMEEAVRGAEQDATAEEEWREPPQEEQEAEEPCLPVQGGKVWKAQAAHWTSLPPRGPGSVSSPSGAAMELVWVEEEAWRPEGRVSGAGWVEWAGQGTPPAASGVLQRSRIATRWGAPRRCCQGTCWVGVPTPSEGVTDTFYTRVVIHLSYSTFIYRWRWGEIKLHWSSNTSHTGYMHMLSSYGHIEPLNFKWRQQLNLNWGGKGENPLNFFGLDWITLSFYSKSHHLHPEINHSGMHCRQAQPESYM